MGHQILNAYSIHDLLNSKVHNILNVFSPIESSFRGKVQLHPCERVSTKLNACTQLNSYPFGCMHIQLDMFQVETYRCLHE